MSIQDAVNAICKLYGHAPSGGPHLIYEVLGEFHPGHPNEKERERRRKELKFPPKRETTAIPYEDWPETGS